MSQTQITSGTNQQEKKERKKEGNKNQQWLTSIG